jgi:Sec-independent protein secretion pathway component TatC
MFRELFPVNEHVLERIVRVIVGLGLLAAVVFVSGAWWGWFGVVPLATGLLGSCPAYRLLGISTCEGTPTATR